MTTRFRLQEVLDAAGVSQSELSRQSGVTVVTINGMCRNRTRGVSLDTLDKIAAALKVEPGELLEREPTGRRRGR